MFLIQIFQIIILNMASTVVTVSLSLSTWLHTNVWGNHIMMINLDFHYRVQTLEALISLHGIINFPVFQFIWLHQCPLSSVRHFLHFDNFASRKSTVMHKRKSQIF